MKISTPEALIPRGRDESQNIHKDGDDVCEEGYGCKDVLFGADWVLMLSSHNHLRVVNQVQLRKKKQQKHYREL